MRRTHIRVLFGVALLVLVAGASTIAARAQTYKVAYEFGSHSGDPLSPQYSLVAQGRDGNLYSTSPKGGTGNVGTVFKITPTGTLTVLYSFDVTHGAYPYGGLTLGTDGNFYGTTYQGGTGGGGGTVFMITPAGTLTVLHNLKSGTDGTSPYAAPVQGTDGNFYGTTYNGGSKGYGTVYKMTPAGTLTTLYPFDNTHGGQPQGPLVQGTDGNFYGTTYSGGTSGRGTVFKVTAGGKLTVLHNFATTDGFQPYDPLIQGTDGNFYGTTYGGGTGSGVIFKITSAGVLTVLHNLNGTTDGAASLTGLSQAADGNLYGTALRGGANALGTIYRISTSGVFSVLYNFDRPTGDTPEVTLLQHTTGTLYGETIEGGGHNTGVFYSFKNGLKPFVRLLPTSGKVGKTIEVLGQGFNGTTNVSFSGTTATFSIVSDTYLTAIVPAGATTGTVTVTTPGGKLASNQKFRVTPAIKTFNPTSGTVGTPVVITGVSLTQTTKVTFGGVKATSFTKDSDTQVTATVPTGAKTGKIAITTAGGTATSSGVFTVTP
jgi:uncharacterized repeat protein (TIGR03803 family)